MKRFAYVLCIFGLVPLAAAWAQSTDPNTADQSPQDRVRGGMIRSTAPGNWIRSAIVRHGEFQAERVIRARNGGDPNTGSSSSGGSTGTGTSGSSTTGLSSLLDLANQFTSTGSLGLGSISDLGSLVSGLTSLGGTTTTTGSTSGSTGGTTSLQQLLDLRDAAIGSSGTNTTGSTLKSTQRSSAASTTTAGGAIGKLWKPGDRSQSTTTDETRSFKDRLLESWSTAAFTAMTVGFQTPAFVDFLETGLRAIFRPKATPEVVSIVNAISDFLNSLIEADNTDSGDDSADDGSTDDDTGDGGGDSVL